jgi:hypothetical protein
MLPTWTLRIRPNRDVNEFAFLEPVMLELKLTNSSGRPQRIDPDLLADGKHITVFVGREGGTTRQWNPFVTRCHDEEVEEIAPGASIYGAHLISASTGGWLIDEPGFYNIQAAVDLEDEVFVSNVLRLYVAPPASSEESRMAPDYFTEDVGRVIAFDGAPELTSATDTLREVTERLPGTPAATHAADAVSAPLLRDYKRLEAGATREALVVRGAEARVEEAAAAQAAALLKAPEAAAETLGHIQYFADLDRLATALEATGDTKGALRVLRTSIATMRKRGVIETVIEEAENKVSALK